MTPLLRRLKTFVPTALLAVFILNPASLRAEKTAPVAFDAANLLYEKGQFAAAASAYEKIIADGTRTSALLFNAGNAYFKSEKIGEAVACWLQAEALDPRNNRIRINLEFARESISGGAQPVPLWPSQLRVLTVNEWAALSLVAGWLCFTGLALGAWKPTLRPTLRVPVLMSSVGLAVVVTLLVITAGDRTDTVNAIVVKPEAVVRFGPLPESQSAFIARDGSEFRMTDRKNGWLRVEDANGREGWFTSDQVILLRGGKPVAEQETDR